MVGLALALSASVGWGVADFLGGVQARRLPLLQVVLYSQAIALAVVVVVLLARWHAPPPVTQLLPAVGGGLVGIAGLTAFYRALAIGKMSIVAPIAATGVCVPVIVGIAGGDRPAALQLVGVFAAIVGVVLVSREPEAEEERRRATRSSIVLAGIAAVGFGAFAVGIRESAQHDVLWSVVAARGSSVFVLAVAFVIAGAKRERAASAWVPLVVMGTVDLAANIVYAVATRHGLLSLVAVGASLYPLATVTLARTLLGERVRRSQEVGIVAAVAGIALIAAG